MKNKATAKTASIDNAKTIAMLSFGVVSGLVYYLLVL